MARLASMEKMGYYPTPDKTLESIKDKILCEDNSTSLDPCCGTGEALKKLEEYYNYTFSYGIELDGNRYNDARITLNTAICGSIFETIIKPLECFSLLFLNPPYDWEKGERMEYIFLKESFRWLQREGLLIYIIPEYILLSNSKIISFLKRRFKDIKIYRVAEEDYPAFKQIVLFGIKREKETEEELSNFPLPPYEYIDKDEEKHIYEVKRGIKPEVFEIRGINAEIINAYQETARKNITETLKEKNSKEKKMLSPIFMLKKGHIFQLLMSGAINGLIKKGDEEMVFKCHTARIEITTEDEKHIRTKNTYVPNIRIIKRGKWYDVS